MRPDLPRDFEQVAKTLRRDESRRRTFSFQQRIGHHRRAETYESDIVSVAPDLRDDFADACERRLMRLARCREQFVPRDLAGLRVEEKQIGEGAADVDADAVTRCRGRCAQNGLLDTDVCGLDDFAVQRGFLLYVVEELRRRVGRRFRALRDHKLFHIG